MQEQHLSDTVNELLQSYKRTPNLMGDYDAFLPNRAKIVELIMLCRTLMFPGYFAPQSLDDETGAYQIGGFILQVQAGLSEEIFHALCHLRRQTLGQAACDDCNAEQEHAALAAQKFIRCLPAIRELVSSDIEAAFEGDPAAFSYTEVILSYPGVFAVFIHRLAHALFRLDIPMIPRVMSEYAHNKTGIDIHPGAQIGPYFFIDHGTGVVIGETSVIGSRVKLYQGVTLGALSTRGGRRLHGQRRHPTLGDDVTVYGGATILGGETVIGDGVTIGGNVFIAQSVDPSLKVVMRSQDLEFRE